MEKMMVLDQDSKEVRYFSRNLMCPTSGYLSQNAKDYLENFLVTVGGVIIKEI
jgi:excinuclease ABC subunit A